MLSRLLPAVMVLSMNLLPSIANAEDRELFEVRHYVLGENGDETILDTYFETALVPALNRQGISSVGVFAYPESLNADVGPNQRVSPRMIVVIPYKSAAQIAEVAKAVEADSEYQSAGESYLQRAHNVKPFARIESELLIGMDCLPTTNIPDGTLSNPDRVYELRLYESANERLGHKKVSMFNNGEVPIFVDCGIESIFIGQALIGPKQPSLTYLTVYSSDEARNESWKKFRSHPDWKVLSGDAQYANTVSRIDKLVLKAKSYSQM